MDLTIDLLRSQSFAVVVVMILARTVVIGTGLHKPRGIATHLETRPAELTVLLLLHSSAGAGGKITIMCTYSIM